LPMDKKQMIASVIMTLIIAAFMALSPGYIISSRAPLTMQREPERAEGYQGIITVWHIAGFKPYRGSLGSWLADVAASLEKRHSGVYFEVDSITVEEYQARILRGEQPDVFSFPLGCANVEQLLELDTELPPLRGNLQGVGRYDGRLYAVPYAASGYLLVHNQRLVQELGADCDSMEEALKGGSVSAAGNAVTAYIYGISGEVLSEEDFLEEKAVSAFLDGRAAGDLELKVQNGKGFPFQASRFGNYSDLVQLIGVNSKIEGEKLPCIYELIEACLSVERQQSLCSIGLMPGAAEAAPHKAEDEALEILFAQLEEIAAPNSFLYKTYREQLEISAAEAMRGSSSAKKDIELRLTELVRGATIK